MVHGSATARHAPGAARETGRPLEAVGNGAKPDRLGAVLALVVGDLARPWAKQRRTRGLIPGTGQRPSEPARRAEMGTGELGQQQSARMAELREDYRVVGVERRAPLARRPTGQIISHPAGRPPDRGRDRGTGAGRPPFRP